MRIDYRILWIDDSKEWVESKLENIEDYLDNFGFKLVPQITDDFRNVDFSQYDIIAVDYNLSNDEKGTEAIKIIRDKDVFTEILFYSRHPEGELREEMKKNSTDGVYCSSRDNFLERLQKLILTTIRKTQEINNLRGLVMAETSHLDSIIRDFLIKNNWDVKSLQSIVCKLKKSHIDAHNDLDKYKSPKDMSILINNPIYFSAGFALSILLNMFDEKIITEIKGYKDIISKRHVLAHGREIFSSADKMVVQRLRSNGEIEEVAFTPDDFIELRKNIKNFRYKFEKMFNKK